MTTYQLLQTLGRPVAYGYHSEEQTLPYLIIIGDGQDIFAADNTIYYKQNRERIEYYYKHKDPTFEDRLETLLTENGRQYSKSEDIYIESEDLFVIYYYI